MHILILAIGTRGDVQPFVALGIAARTAGHAVTLAAPESSAGLVQAANLPFAPLPVDFQALLQEPEIQEALKSFSGKLKAYRWTSDIMNKQLTSLWNIGLEANPDVILFHPKASLGPYLARHMGVTALPVFLQPGFAPTGNFPQFMIGSQSTNRVFNHASHHLILTAMRLGVGNLIKRWRRSSGIEIGDSMNPLLGYGRGQATPRLHAYSPTVIPRPADWSERETQTGYWFMDPAPFDPPAALERFLADGPPPIYVGFGSMPGMDHDRTTNALIGALTQTGQRAVLATGWGGIEGMETGDNLFVLDAVPHAWLFPRVSAVVHHGGSGTTHEGLRWGRPSVICPVFGDQPFFGTRVQALGVGPAPIRQKHLTAAGLAQAIQTALLPMTIDRARDLGARIRAETGTATAMRIIESQGPASRPKSL